MATIIPRYKNKDKTSGKPIAFEWRVIRKGFRPVYGTAPSKAEAKKQAERVEAQIRAGVYRMDGERTVSEMIGLRLAYLAPRIEQRDATRPGRTRHQRVGWIEGHAQQLGWWCTRLGDRFASSITAAEVEDLLGGLLRVGKSKGTVNRYHSSLSAAFETARKAHKWTVDNPCRLVSYLKENENRRLAFLDPSTDQQSRLLAACARQSRELHEIVAVAIESGGRRTWIEFLRWSHLELHAEPDMGWVTFRGTKNGTDVRVPLMGLALRLLRTREAEIAHLPGDLVWRRTQGRGSQQGRRRGLSDGEQPYFTEAQWIAARNEAGLYGFAFHSLRHTRGALLTMAHATVPEVQRLLGHSTPRAAQIYMHQNSQAVADVARRTAAAYPAQGENDATS